MDSPFLGEPSLTYCLDLGSQYSFTTVQGVRTYDGLIGSWMEPDPTGSLLAYTYDGDNPLSNVDPSGMNAQGDASIPIIAHVSTQSECPTIDPLDATFFAVQDAISNAIGDFYSGGEAGWSPQWYQSQSASCWPQLGGSSSRLGVATLPIIAVVGVTGAGNHQNLPSSALHAYIYFKVDHFWKQHLSCYLTSSQSRFLDAVAADLNRYVADGEWDLSWWGSEPRKVGHG